MNLIQYFLTFLMSTLAISTMAMDKEGKESTQDIIFDCENKKPLSILNTLSENAKSTWENVKHDALSYHFEQNKSPLQIAVDKISNIPAKMQEKRLPEIIDFFLCDVLPCIHFGKGQVIVRDHINIKKFQKRGIIQNSQYIDKALLDNITVEGWDDLTVHDKRKLALLLSKNYVEKVDVNKIFNNQVKSWFAKKSLEQQKNKTPIHPNIFAETDLVIIPEAIEFIKRLGTLNLKSYSDYKNIKLSILEKNLLASLSYGKMDLHCLHCSCKKEFQLLKKDIKESACPKFLEKGKDFYEIMRNWMEKIATLRDETETAINITKEKMLSFSKKFKEIVEIQNNVKKTKNELYPVQKISVIKQREKKLFVSPQIFTGSDGLEPHPNAQNSTNKSDFLNFTSSTSDKQDKKNDKKLLKNQSLEDQKKKSEFLKKQEEEKKRNEHSYLIKQAEEAAKKLNNQQKDEVILIELCTPSKKFSNIKKEKEEKIRNIFKNITKEEKKLDINIIHAKAKMAFGSDAELIQDTFVTIRLNKKYRYSISLRNGKIIWELSNHYKGTDI